MQHELWHVLRPALGVWERAALQDCLDEISLSAPTSVCEIKDGTFGEYVIDMFISNRVTGVVMASRDVQIEKPEHYEVLSPEVKC